MAAGVRRRPPVDRHGSPELDLTRIQSAAGAESCPPPRQHPGSCTRQREEKKPEANGK